MSKKLVRLEITITGTMAVSDNTLRITVVLIGVLVIATLTAAIIQTIAIVGWTWGMPKAIGDREVKRLKNIR